MYPAYEGESKGEEPGNCRGNLLLYTREKLFSGILTSSLGPC
jgi:hypothetical protein